MRIWDHIHPCGCEIDLQSTLPASPIAEDDSVVAEIFVGVFGVFSSGQGNVYWLLYTYDSYTKKYIPL
jgi:hypothetical protein